MLELCALAVKELLGEREAALAEFAAADAEHVRIFNRRFVLRSRLDRLNAAVAALEALASDDPDPGSPPGSESSIFG